MMPFFDVRAAFELAHPEHSARQLTDVHGDPDRVDDLLGRELAARDLESWVRGTPSGVIERHMTAELRHGGQFEHLERRAARKREVLEALGNPLAAAALRGPQDLQPRTGTSAAALARSCPMTSANMPAHTGSSTPTH
ncbi:MAG: hypothetical protein M5U09_20995 [Gammaproteobacteria bacterium]|nr:hypothetical protein [Gammaproteobacteria bacterium]